jgi:hypothetical protein
MSIWDDVLRADAAFAFTDPDGFGAESVVYTNDRWRPPARSTRRCSGTRPTRLTANGDQPVPTVRVFLPYSTDATKGISTRRASRGTRSPSP